jgi:hypothetical protein
MIMFSKRHVRYYGIPLHSPRVLTKTSICIARLYILSTFATKPNPNDSSLV